MLDYNLYSNEEQVPAQEMGLGQGLVLKRARAKVQSPGGVLSNTVRSEGGSMLPQTLRSRAMDLRKRVEDMESQEPDITGAIDFARQQGQQGEAAMLNALAAQYAGESFAPLQGAFMKRAEASRAPMKVGSVMITPQGEVIRDTYAERDRRIAALERQADTAERTAATVEEAQARREETERRNREMERQGQEGLAIRRSLAESVRNNRQSGQAGTFSPAGFTPSGQQVVTNSKSGVSYLLSLQPDGTPIYTPYQGAMIPKGTFDKEVIAAGDLSAVAARADKLIQDVEANPQAFGLRSAAVSAVPGAVQGYAAKAVGLTPQQLEARSTVLRQAAQEINELYGAALSMGEQARANTFLPNPADPPEMLISKLKAARDWAKTQTNRYSPGVSAAARARSGGAPAQPTGGGLTPEEQAELQKLREKHKRGQ